MKKLTEFLASFGVDKYMHVIAGLIIGVFFITIFPVKLPIIPVLLIGTLKEVYDHFKPYGKFDLWDILATVIGGLFVQLMILI